MVFVILVFYSINDDFRASRLPGHLPPLPAGGDGGGVSWSEMVTEVMWEAVEDDVLICDVTY